MSLNPATNGSAGSWLRASANHHMTFVIFQISSLFGSSIVSGLPPAIA